jgi:ubiquitin carboxyl-terminal hydrolase L5
LKAGPVGLGPAVEDWTDNVMPIIEARMQKYQQGEIHFNLMAIIQDRTVR